MLFDDLLDLLKDANPYFVEGTYIVSIMGEEPYSEVFRDMESFLDSSIANDDDYKGYLVSNINSQPCVSMTITLTPMEG